jgi:hypothetical protein
MNEYLLRSMRNKVEKRENKQPLQLILHVNGFNEIDEYRNYIKTKNLSHKLFYIYLTHRGVNIIVAPHLL